MFEKAALLSDRHGPMVGTRTLDILHVAAALVLDAKRFLTFDQRQHTLAKKAGLEVAP